MTRDSASFIDILEEYLDEHEGHTPLPDAARDAIRAELPSIHQRPAWWPGRRLSEMSNLAVLGAAAAVIALAAMIGYTYVAGPNIGGPPADPSVPPLLQSDAATRLPNAHTPLDAGRYVLGAAYPLTITFEVTDDWESCPGGMHEQGVCLFPPRAGDAPPNVGVTFLVVDNLVTEPCETTVLDPPVGPTVDDLVAAITDLDGFDVTAPEDVTVGGYPAKRIIVTAPTVVPFGCDLRTWVTPTRTNIVGPAEVNRMYVIDAGGVRIVTSTAYLEKDASPEDLAAADAVVASIQIGR